ncbi:hypothetical protein OFN55_39425, partial [Escherichia coli]|nr:hypothetical protein [Escherichia coli]
RNKLVRLYQFIDDKFVMLKNLSVPDMPRTVLYVGNNLFIGYQREYNLVRVTTGEVTVLTASPGRDTKPVLTFVEPQSILCVLP